MLPIILHHHACKIGLAGDGDGLRRRQSMLAAAGVTPVSVPPDVGEAALDTLGLLFVAGLAEEPSRALAARAQAAGVLVNVEDMPALCDFHVPAAVRRGELLLTVSTGGKAPGLARMIREWIEARFGEDWTGRLAEAEQARASWRAAGAGPSDVARRLRALVSDRGWLA